MNKQQFLDLGLTEEQATKAEEESKKELEGYIPKTRFNEVNEAKKKAEEEVKSREKQIEEIKKNVGDNEALQKQIETLQADNKKAKEEYDKELKDLQISNAIKLALGDKAQDTDLVAGLFDKSKLILGDDGKVTGLDEQLKNLKETKSFLFKEDKQPDPAPQQGFKLGGNGGGNNPAPQQGTPSIKDALTSMFNK